MMFHLILLVATMSVTMPMSMSMSMTIFMSMGVDKAKTEVKRLASSLGLGLEDGVHNKFNDNHVNDNVDDGDAANRCDLPPAFWCNSVQIARRCQVSDTHTTYSSA